MGARVLIVGATATLAAAACVPPPDSGPPGMRYAAAREHALDPSFVELARSEPKENERALLVVFPRSACSGSASGVVVDERGHFLGAIAPGTAAMLTLPTDVSTVALFSSVEVTAPVGTWHDTRRISIPNAASRSGIVLRSTRWSARECATGQYFDVEVATKQALENELAENDVRWVSPVRDAGQAWLDSHGTRVAEVLSTPPSGGPPGDITHLILR